MSDIAIKVEKLNKSFNIPLEKKTSLKDYFLHPLSIFKNKTRKFEALKDISFEIKKGEFVGIIGRNGSGKSTLLKILSSIYEPDSGNIEINGKVVSFLELGVGFNPELSARENVYLNATILGMGRDFIKQNFDEIIKFAELENFVEMPLKNFSSGMAVRLAFSIAMKANADIYLLDEVMAVGDAVFQRKCFEYFERIKKENKTIFLVSHSMKDVLQICGKCILFEKNLLKKIGEVKDVVEYYEDENKKDFEKSEEKIKKWGSGEIKIQNVKIKNKQGIETDLFLENDNLYFEILLAEPILNKDANIGISLQQNSVNIFMSSTQESNVSIVGKNRVILEINDIPLNGVFDVVCGVTEKNNWSNPFDAILKKNAITIKSKEKKEGIINLNNKWV